MAVLLTDLLEERPLGLFIKPDQFLHHHHFACLPVCHLCGDTEARRLGTDRVALCPPGRRPQPHPRTARGQGGTWLSQAFQVMSPAPMGQDLTAPSYVRKWGLGRLPDSTQGHPAGGGMAWGSGDHLTQRPALSSAPLSGLLETQRRFHQGLPCPGKGTRNRA